MGEKRDDASCRRVMVINGNELMARMVGAGYSEAELASKAGVSEQTIRNYSKSCEEQPWLANPAVVRKVCRVLGADSRELVLEIDIVESPEEDRARLADLRFLANPATVRSVEGQWDASSEDLEIPGFVTYQKPMPWNATLEIRQNGNEILATGIDKDGDGVLAKGALFEEGNWIRFHYWIDNPRLREYGVAMAEFKGDGNTISGLFVGRDGPHESSVGLVVSKITLNRIHR